MSQLFNDAFRDRADLLHRQAYHQQLLDGEVEEGADRGKVREEAPLAERGALSQQEEASELRAIAIAGAAIITLALAVWGIVYLMN